ncbi:MAG: DUF2267 domain-containing protein [Armatimonadota bacterium]
MHYDEFVGQVQHRARLASEGDAVRAIHATLQTLSERLYGDEASDLAAQLPLEIGAYLKEPVVQDSFDLKEFYQRVAIRENADLQDAVYHARAVISVVLDAVSRGEIDDMLAQLPNEYQGLFTWTGEGGMRRAA